MQPGSGLLAVWTIDVNELTDDNDRTIIRHEVFAVRIQMLPPHTRQLVILLIPMSNQRTRLVDGREVG